MATSHQMATSNMCTVCTHTNTHTHSLFLTVTKVLCILNCIKLKDCFMFYELAIFVCECLCIYSESSSGVCLPTKVAKLLSQAHRKYVHFSPETDTLDSKILCIYMNLSLNYVTQLALFLCKWLFKIHPHLLARVHALQLKIKWHLFRWYHVFKR